MNLKPGNLITVKNAPGSIRNGDALRILKIGVDVDPDCYVVASPHDGRTHLLHEDDVKLSTNAERIRSMSDEEIALLLFKVASTGSATVNGKKLKTVDDCKEWLKESAPVVDVTE